MSTTTGSPAYRLLVLTRNLGNGNSWDIAVRLDSEEVSGRPQAYQPTSRRLPRRSPGPHGARLAPLGAASGLAAR